MALQTSHHPLTYDRSSKVGERGGSGEAAMVKAAGGGAIGMWGLERGGSRVAVRQRRHAGGGETARGEVE